MFYMELFILKLLDTYSRICNDFTIFSERVIRITDDVIRLRRMFVLIVGKHGLMRKFGTECRDILIP